MSNSLRDQLLKAGLADEKQVKAIEAEKHKQRKRARKGAKNRVTTTETEEARQIAQMYRQRQAERDRELNRQREEERKQKERAAQARDLVQRTAIKRADGDIAYNFTLGPRIKRLYVSAAEQKQLVEGKLAIVRRKNAFSLVPADTARKLQSLESKLLVHYNEPGADDTDDAYKDYPVPDDLMW